jgi:hypothetical protein
MILTLLLKEATMSEITDILSEINIPRDKAILLEHALEKKYVAHLVFQVYNGKRRI